MEYRDNVAVASGRMVCYATARERFTQIYSTPVCVAIEERIKHLQRYENFLYLSLDSITLNLCMIKNREKLGLLEVCDVRTVSSL